MFWFMVKWSTAVAKSKEHSLSKTELGRVNIIWNDLCNISARGDQRNGAKMAAKQTDMTEDNGKDKIKIFKAFQ